MPYGFNVSLGIIKKEGGYHSFELLLIRNVHILTFSSHINRPAYMERPANSLFMSGGLYQEQAVLCSSVRASPDLELQSMF